jgi:hypothetical protein
MTEAMGAAPKLYKLGFYVPASHLEAVKMALFDAGAGRIGDYDRCCWQVAGEGQFRPLAGSSPHIGVQGEVERVSEFRVEMVLHAEHASAAVAALRLAHPYEEPAWDMVALVTGLG